jgi:hypothetical protein
MPSCELPAKRITASEILDLFAVSADTPAVAITSLMFSNYSSVKSVSP